MLRYFSIMSFCLVFQNSTADAATFPITISGESGATTSEVYSFPAGIYKFEYEYTSISDGEASLHMSIVKPANPDATGGGFSSATEAGADSGSSFFLPGVKCRLTWRPLTAIGL